MKTRDGIMKTRDEIKKPVMVILKPVMAPSGTGVGRGWLVTLLSGVLLAYVLVVLSFGVFSFDFMISLINLVFSELPLVNVMSLILYEC